MNAFNCRGRTVTVGEAANIAREPIHIAIPETLLCRLEENHETAPDGVIQELEDILQSFDWHNIRRPELKEGDAVLAVYITPELVFDLKGICGLNPMIELAHIIWEMMHNYHQPRLSNEFDIKKSEIKYFQHSGFRRYDLNNIMTEMRDALIAKHGMPLHATPFVEAAIDKLIDMQNSEKEPTREDLVLMLKHVFEYVACSTYVDLDMLIREIDTILLSDTEVA